MRLGLRDILGLAGFEQNLTELSALADACLQYALEAVMRRNRLRFKTPPIAIVGLGKLGGGCEIDYGSDLDIIFVTGAIETKICPDYGRLAVTGAGVAVAPDGTRG
jgi:glutamine synthetase adenylyltransferase